MITKKIVLLANSRKHSERCLAGIELGTQQYNWIRPVSSRSGEGLDERERRYSDDSEPAVLDVISVPVKHANPHGCQQENWLIDEGYYWEKEGSMEWEDALAYARAPAVLWKNGNSTYYGENDEVEAEISQKMSYSICMLRAQQVVIHAFVNRFDGNRKVQASFRHNGTTYRLPVTDSIYEPLYKSKQQGDYNIGECLLTISLAEPYLKQKDGKHYQYKLIAAIIPKSV